MNTSAINSTASPTRNNGRSPVNRSASPAAPNLPPGAAPSFLPGTAHNLPPGAAPLPPNRSNATSDINSDRNNNATPPQRVNATNITTPPMGPRRPSQHRSPLPQGARPKDLPPGAAPLGTIPRPNVPPPSTSSSPGISVPLLASQLGRPVNLGDRGPPGSSVPSGLYPSATTSGGLLGPGLPLFTPHHLNLLSHTLSPFAAIPAGNGRIMAKNINGTCK